MTYLHLSRSKRQRDTGQVLLTIAGLITGFGVASCCGLPFILATLGLRTAY
jgi:mercuric ion transport protein